MYENYLERNSASILKLDTVTANQIAAGEVVERPGAALKEILENSLDANATKIEIQLEEAGQKKLQVSDNGFGIRPSELKLAIARHATSKIRNSQDLFQIKSLGFRGEALASISAISRFRISSRTQNQDMAYEILCEAGEVIQEQSISQQFGTIVTIENLFFNTPARKKFLRSQAAETKFCLQIVYRLALANPQCSFTLTVDNKAAANFPAVTDAKDRVTQVFRAAFKTNVPKSELIYFSDSREGTKVYGFLFPMKYCLPTTKGIFTFINGRSVKDKLIQQAILSAGKEVLFSHEYPQTVLFVDIDVNGVDVNVHPTKAEVRFRDPSNVFILIKKTILASLTKLRINTSSIESENMADSQLQTNTDLSRADAHLQSSAMNLRTNSNESISFREQAPEFTDNFSNSTQARLDMPSSTYFQQKDQDSFVSEKVNGPQFLATMKNTYIICQDDNGILFIDQHAAHERITYEKLRKTQLGKDMPSSPLLIPIVVEVTEENMSLLEPHFAALRRLGLYLERFGPTQLRILELPALLMRKDGSAKISFSNFILNLVESLAENDDPEFLHEKLLDVFLDSLASQSCHGSVRAGQNLSPMESIALIQQMEETDFSGHCPHGRPTSVHLSWNKIEKLFKRRL